MKLETVLTRDHDVFMARTGNRRGEVDVCLERGLANAVITHANDCGSFDHVSMNLSLLSM